MLKNRGKQLQDLFVGGERPIPPEFIAAMNRWETRQPVPNDVLPGSTTDTVVESRVVTDRTDERMLVTVGKNPGNITLSDIRQTDDGQAVQIVRTLYRTDTPPVPFPIATATRDVAKRDLGNGFSIVETAIAGTFDTSGGFVEGFFGGTLYGKTRVNLIPAEFRPAIPEVTTRTETAGTAVVPTLTGNELSETQEQLTPYRRRVTTITQDDPTLPVILDKGKEANQWKQEVGVVRTLRPDTDVFAAQSATQEVVVRQLGNGMAEETKKSVSSVFPRNVFERSISDALPQEFRALQQTVTTESTSSGTAADPTLNVGDLSRRDEQLDTFLHRLIVTSRSAASVPATLVESFINDVGLAVARTKTLDNGVQTITPSALRSGQVINLGNGQSVSQVDDLPSVFGGALYRAEREDQTPGKFRAAIPALTTASTASGSAAAPSLAPGDLSATSQQVTAFTRRNEVVSRAGVTLPVSLTEYDTSNVRQVVTAVETLQSDVTVPAVPSALQTVLVQNLGDGRVVQRVESVPSLFSASRYEAEKPELVPLKFRGALPSQTTRVDETGTAVLPTLGSTDIAAFQEQLNTFVRRRSVTTRDSASLPITLSGLRVLENGLVATVAETLDNTAQTITGSATLEEGEVDNLGGGLTLKRTVTSPSVFAAPVFRTQKPENVPAEFRAEIPTETTLSTVSGTAAMPSLGATDVEASEEQLTAFLKRIMTSSRAAVTYPVTLSDTRTNEFGQNISVSRVLHNVAQSITPSATVSGEVRSLGGGLTLKEQETLPGIFGRNVYSSERQDLVPPRFRGAAPITTTSAVSSGTAAPPTLGTDDVSKTERQLTAFLKQVEIATRAGLTLPVTLTGTRTNEVGQLVSVSDVLDTGLQTFTPTALVRGEVTDLGSGQSVLRTETLPGVFERRLYGAEKPELIPAKFRGALPLTTTRVDEAGTAAAPTLSAGQVSAQQEQIDAFLRRVTTSARSTVSLPLTLSGQQFLPNGLVATVAETLDASAQTITGSATLVDASVDNLGDSLTLKRTVTAPSVFAEPLYRAAKTDNIPVEFRAEIPATTFENTVSGTAAAPTLGATDLEAEERQLTNFLKRISTTSRAGVTYPVTITGTRTNEFGQNVAISRVLNNAGQTLTPTALVSGEVRGLGGGLTLKEQETLPGVFGRNVFEVERNDLVPLRFRGVAPVTTTSSVSSGTATTPTLASGDIRRREAQLTEFLKQVEIASRAGLTLPITLTGKDTDSAKRVVTVAGTLQSELDAIASPSALQDVVVEAVGDGNVVQTVRSVPAVFGGARYAVDVQDPTPLKFRVAAPATTTELTAAGTAAAPTLGTGELSKSSTQLDLYTKRDSVTSRAGITLPVVLVGKDTDSARRVVTVTESLQSAATTPATPSATQTVEVNTLGDGNVIQTVRSVGSVFGAQLFAAQKPELIPLKFRGALPSETTRVDESGTAAMPTLGAGDVEASQEQIDTFIRRVTTTTRGSTSLPITLSGQRFLPSGLVATVAETLDDTVQTITGSATLVEGDVDNLGDGLTLKRTITAPSIFSEVEHSAEKSENIPVEFRAAIPAVTLAQTVSGTAAAPTLGATDVAASERQLTAFLKRTSVTSRAGVTYPVTLTGSRVNEFGQLVAVDRILDDAAQTITPSATVSGEVRDLGGGLTLKELETLPGVFARSRYEKSIPNLIPESFRGTAPTSVTSTTSAGTAAAPTLGTGEFERVSEQLTNFLKRDTVTSIGSITLPVVQSGGRVITPEGQLGTLTRTLTDVAPTLTPAATLLDGRIDELGAGLYLKSETTVGSVFGRNLYAAERSDNTPAKFRGAAPAITTESVSAGTASAPTLSAGDLSATSQQLTLSTKLDRLTTRAGVTLPLALVDYDTNPDKQVVTITDTLQSDATTPAVPSATQDVVVQNLGDGRVVQSVRAISSVLPKPRYTKRVPQLIPEEFLASVPITTTATTTSGSAAMPTLGTGELRRSSEQLDAFIKRDEVESIGSVVFPIVQNAGRVITADGQLGTLTRTLDNTTLTLTPAATLLDGSIKEVGGGMFIKEELTVASVFPRSTFEVSVPEILPERWRAAIPATETSSVTAGTATTPTLSAGDVRKSEEQLTQNTKRVTTLNRPAGSALTLTGKELRDGLLVTQTERYDPAGGQSIASEAGDHLTLNAEIAPLGNGSDIKTVGTVTSYPVKQGQVYDRELDILVPFEDNTLENGTGLGTARTEITPIDYKRVNARTFTAPVAALDAYVVAFHGTADVDFPAVLNAINVVWDTSEGTGNFSETGSGAAAGTQASLALSLRGSSQASAHAVPEIIPYIDAAFTAELPFVDYFFFLPNPVTRAQILTKVSTLAGGTVFDWPVFRPKGATFILTGQKVAVGANSVAQCNSSVSSSGASFATSSGGGTDVDSGPTVRAVVLPPTIHGSISLSGDTVKVVSATASSSANTGSGTNYPGASHSDTTTKSATGTVTPVGLAPTNVTAIPFSGLYMRRCDMELFRYGYSSVRARVFDMSDL